MTIAALDLSFGYRGVALGHVADLAAAPGEVLCLLGPNGSGKTTLLKTLLGLLPAISGTVLLNGAALDALSAQAIARVVGYVPQAGPTTFPFTALEIVLMGRAARIGLFASPSSDDHEAAATALESLGVGRLASRLFTELSGGERQMVLIARALAQEPSILVMDEPTASLDFGNQSEVLATIAAVATQGLSVVFSTHDPDHALSVASRVALLRDGRMIATGSPRETVTPELMKRLYDVDVAIVYVAAIGRETCVPFPRSPYRPNPNRRKNPMKISARNQLKGKITEIVKGATTAHVRIDVAGTVITSAITNEAVDELKLAVGQDAFAVVKASDVMIAID